MGRRTPARKSLEYVGSCRCSFVAARCSRIRCATDEKAGLEEIRHIAAAVLRPIAGEKSLLRSEPFGERKHLFPSIMAQHCWLWLMTAVVCENGLIAATASAVPECNNDKLLQKLDKDMFSSDGLLLLYQIGNFPPIIAWVHCALGSSR